MSLSVGNRRAIQSQTQSLGVQSQSHLAATYRSRLETPRIGLQRQRSFFTSGNEDITSVRREFMRRGVSVGRSFDGIRQTKSASITLERRKNLVSSQTPLQRQFSLSEQPASNSAKLRKDQFRSKYFGSLSRYAGNEKFSELAKPLNSTKKTAWSSTTSLLKSFEEELAQNNDPKKSNTKVNTSNNNSKSSNQISCSSPNDDLKNTENDTTTRQSTNDPNKFNISIVLSQTIEAITENDVDSASETAEPEKHSKLNQAAQNRNQTSSSNRRNQLQQINSKNQQEKLNNSPDTSSTIANGNSLTSGNGENNLNVSTLTIQRRPPLIRAMSAPVRTLDDSNKNLLSMNKRKSRRRKLNSTYSPPDKSEFDVQHNDANANAENANKNGGKKGFSRSISALAPDVITLVSLVSSEGSDSERDDGCETITQTHSARRAPSLRRTGKSVSFQENDPPNFQFNSKEFPTMRRGSIVQLAARIRANRPNATSPVSIFLAEAYNCDRNIISSSSLSNGESAPETTSTHVERRKMSLIRESEISDSTNDKSSQDVDEDYPEYVRTLKERECWKLFQKMSKKGVVVTYDTILRGMLTPTELRQLQKQREIEEAKARKSEIEKETEQSEKKSTAVTAIERLSEVLLKK